MIDQMIHHLLLEGHQVLCPTELRAQSLGPAAADKELNDLVKHGTWYEDSMDNATTGIVPCKWVFRIKKTSEGVVIKHKGRIVVRGDLQQDDGDDNYSPVASWSSVRTFLIISVILGWFTTSIDFESAFVQASMPEDKPVWIQIPCGYKSTKGPNQCLRLVKSLYGISAAPKLWVAHSSKAFKALGMKQSKFDECLWYGKDIMVVQYVDDCGISAPNQARIDEFIEGLRKQGLKLTQEESFEEFLGIKFKYHDDGSIECTQKGLIQKILVAADMTECNPNSTPAIQTTLGADEGGESMTESWNYRGICGMLLYLSTNTRPDIAFSVSQVCRFSSAPKKSHATAVKTILRYLKKTADKGMLIKPNNNKFNLDLYVDADFCGLFGRENCRNPDSVRSRTGYIVLLGGWPIIWKSSLQFVLLSSGVISNWVFCLQRPNLATFHDELLQFTPLAVVRPSVSGLMPRGKKGNSTSFYFFCHHHDDIKQSKQNKTTRMNKLKQLHYLFFLFFFFCIISSFAVEVGGKGEEEEVTTTFEEQQQQQEKEKKCSSSSASSHNIINNSDDNSQQGQEGGCSSSSKSNYYHLVVLVHGYMGSDKEQSYLGETMIRQFPSILQKHHQDKKKKDNNINHNNNDDDGYSSNNQQQHNQEHKLIVLSSKVNVGRTTDGVAAGGKRLAIEINQWIQEYFDYIIQNQNQNQKENEEEHDHEIKKINNNNNNIITLSLIGNSLGGLYSRYALAELKLELQQPQHHHHHHHPHHDVKIIPLIFCTTSSPHMGVSKETFIEIPDWAERIAAMAMQQTGEDLFGIIINNPTSNNNNNNNNNNNKLDEDENQNQNQQSSSSLLVTNDMCLKGRYLNPLREFSKRITVANAYNTDFLVSVSSAAFLSSDSNSIHFPIINNINNDDNNDNTDNTDTAATNYYHRQIQNEHAVLHVTTPKTGHHDDDEDNSAATTSTNNTNGDGDDNDSSSNSSSSSSSSRAKCTESLDRLGWHKIFMDTRTHLPEWTQLDIPDKIKFLDDHHDPSQQQLLYYTSRELREHFARYGTLLPVAHPLNMANSKTDLYGIITQKGRPIMDALAELLIWDIIELSEEAAAAATTAAAAATTTTTTSSSSAELVVEGECINQQQQQQQQQQRP